MEIEHQLQTYNVPVCKGCKHLVLVHDEVEGCMTQDCTCLESPSVENSPLPDKLPSLREDSCLLCGEEGDRLGELEQFTFRVYGTIPMNKLVEIWYARGYRPTNAICAACIVK